MQHSMISSSKTVGYLEANHVVVSNLFQHLFTLLLMTFLHNGAKIDITPEKRCTVCRRPQELKITSYDADIQQPEFSDDVAKQIAMSNYQIAVGAKENNIERVRPHENCRKSREFCANNTVKPRGKQRFVRCNAINRLQRSLHAQIPDECDASETPSTSWQQPHDFHSREVRARSTERTPVTSTEANDYSQNDKLWSSQTHQMQKPICRNPMLLTETAFEKLNNTKDERRRSMPNAVLQNTHLSDVARTHLLSIITELVTTEEIYVKYLQKLISQYLRPSNLPMLELTERLIKIQSSFLSSMLDAAGDTINRPEASEQQLRDALIRIFALFIYSEYSAAFLRFQQERKG
uniref:DH domain-containing protein n=1 Tax=Syphacia muris TaxID=451379 RepID=A0A0N5ASY1_9BILA